MKYRDNLSLYRAYVEAEEKAPNEVAIYYQNNKLSFLKLLNHIEKWASILQTDFNVQKGDSVLIALPNIPQTIILVYAVNKIGGVCNMVHPYTPAEGIQKYYDESNCKLAFLFDQRVYKELAAYKKFNGSIVICDFQTFIPRRRRFFDFYFSKTIKALHRNSKFTFFREFKSNHQLAEEVPLTDLDTAVILHSASTTGEAKSIKLSAKSFNYTASRVPELMCMSEEDLIGKTMMSVLPSFHGFGLCMTMLGPLANTFGIALVPKFSAKSVAKMMNHSKTVVAICGVPTVFKSLLKEKAFSKNRYLKVLRSCFSGGDSLPSSVKENFDNLMIKRKSPCRLFEGYGLTEALSVCAVNTHRRHKNGSIGYPMRGVEFQILDDNNNPVETGVVGEIAIKSESTMLGYLGNEEATKATYVNGYLKTGDLGYMDEDGFIYFNSRKKRVIKVSGVAVFPHEIEAVVSHIPGVKGVCAIQIPDEKLINAVKLFVKSDRKNEEEIIEECRKHLIRWAIPKEIEFVNKLPYTKYKKVNFTKLQQEENKKRGIVS